MIARLADAQVAGDLAIAPAIVQVTSEQLRPDLRSRIAAGFGSPPPNSFASIEGLIGGAPPGSEIFDFASDLAIVEFVDADDAPVGPGARAHHVLVTNLFNHAQPLIRYRLDDAMTEVRPSPDHGHQRATLLGRSDDFLCVAGTAVHPMVVRSVMAATPTVAEFQARVRGSSLDVDVVPNGDVDLDAVRRRLSTALAGAGTDGVGVTVTLVDGVERDPRTGKARRFLTALR